MTCNKILFWIDMWFFHYGIAKSLQKKYDCEVSAIIDVGEKEKIFFKKQNFVNFHKKWFFSEHVKNLKKKPNLQYLKLIEQKYQLNIWNLAYGDKFFHPKYNLNYEFTEEEILNLVEQECILYERILEEIKPDFLCLFMTNNHPTQLLYEICKNKKIKILMLIPTKFRGRFLISENEYGVDKVGELNTEILNSKTDEDVEKFWNKYNLLKHVKNFEKTHFKSHTWLRYKAILDFFLDFGDQSYMQRYTNFGRTKFKVLSDKSNRKLKKSVRTSFLDKNLDRKISSKSFVYFPLHYEPERITLTAGRFYPDQITAITNIARSLPVGIKLYVKEHPAQGTLGWRKTSFYKQIMKMPNVKLLHPSVTHEEIMKKCSLVITIAGSAALEAAFFKKPAIILGEMNFPIKAIQKLEKLENLPTLIKTSLNQTYDYNDLKRYIELIEKNSFECDIHGMASDFSYRFGYKGPKMESELPDDKVKSYLTDYKSIFEKLADEHFKKMTQHKNFQSK